MVPPEEIKPIIEKIISNFITEYCNNKHITIGLNAIREILTRMPLALDESQIEYLVAFRSFRNSSVVNATKSLINYFRDVCPQLLPKKFRGRFTKDDGDNRKEDFVFGRSKLNYDIDGIDLLAKHLGYEDGSSLTMNKVLTDEDFKLIKKLKLKEALKHVVKDKQTIKKEEQGEEDKDEDQSLEYESGEELEDEDDEEGEIDLDGDDIDDSNDLQDDSDIEEDDEEVEDDDEESEDQQQQDDSDSPIEDEELS
jgi:protein SDA1